MSTEYRSHVDLVSIEISIKSIDRDHMESVDGHSTAGAFSIRDPFFPQTNRAKAMTVPLIKQNGSPICVEISHSTLIARLY